MTELEQADHDKPEAMLPLSLPKAPPPNWFWGEEGLRAGWRLLIYFLVVLVLSAVASLGALALGGPTPGFSTPLGLLLQDVIGFVVAFGTALVMSRIEHRPVWDYGLPLRGLFGGKFWLGFLFGLVEISLLMGLIGAFGGYSFGTRALYGSEIVRWGAFHLLLFLFVGLFEEFLFRGYTQFTLGSGIGFWPAAILLSLGFGAVHLQNSGEGPVGAAGVAMAGLFFCFALRRTGNLWYAVGLHTSFDWGETFLFSVPDSGLVIPGHLSGSVLHGPNWLTGGTVGPEGSVFCFVTLGMQFLFVALLFPAKKKTSSESAVARV